MRVQFTPSARTQFLAAITYIYRDSPSAAIAFRHKTEKNLIEASEISALRKNPAGIS
jgi:plasmid stabilization system protein ParE